ncbi:MULTISPECIES: DUF389 domain-containing protein [Streptomyces]|uniref:DUF389 domain-containing protein n=1 Tax=Streptomyces TaxID=1883 RepID=UPI000C266284|nr:MULTISPECIES: DUF389 domain-containing protein [unclassified Streptomyces]MBL3806496.1 DUF389 domain-containing protein [Streptomyces sp. BRB081]MDQ0295299.1 putative hydrophobic protein (TIGR00271 family) [Streptomyces sp. DSM 41037]NEE37031.1 DUF389 domain-containing protein [Streptomyces sp. SID7982]PJM84780.1 hypothetical protein CH313_01945 [Streptomyces sp. TSRI0384-2]
MLHLRIITPGERAEDVVTTLREVAGTYNLIVLPGAAREPEGDVVLCDVARETGDDVVHALRELGVDSFGSISVENIDLTVSYGADRAEEEAPGDSADAVLWDQLAETIHEESTLSVTYLAFMTLATTLAACGVVLDNAVLIVGAMAIGPDFGPLAGVSVAVVERRRRLVLRCLICLLVGFAAAIALTVLFSLGMDAAGLFHESQLTGRRPTTEFIVSPDVFSLIVGILAGIAGTLSLTSAKSGALVGVAISVTTIPAAANAAVALSYGNYTQTLASSEQLLLNLVAIAAAGILTLLAQKWLWRLRKRNGATAPKR